ncbi:MAG: nucleoside 2-deoxyribosyltransferase [Patescibacteria group bacterium]
MNIYFAGAIRGGRAEQPKYEEFVRILKQHGTVCSEHVGDETISAYGETDLVAEEIHERELKVLEKSDVVVAEVTTPSLGVGYLIAQAEKMGKRILAFYHGQDSLKLSAMIKGNAHVDVHMYERLEDVERILAESLV